MADVVPLLLIAATKYSARLIKDSPPATSDSDYLALKEFLSFDPMSADQLAENSGLTIDQVSSMLLILELEGEVESLAGGRYSLLP